MQLKQLFQALRLKEIESLFEDAPPLAQPRKNSTGTGLEYAVSSGLIAALTNPPITTLNISEQVAHTITIPGNTLTQIGQHLEFIQAAAAAGTSGTGTLRLRLGSSTGTIISAIPISLGHHISSNRRIYYLAPGLGITHVSTINGSDFATNAGAWIELPINWQQPQTLVVTLQASSTNASATLRMSTVRLFS